ncbi:MAG: hypothetical protein FWD60_12225 [Candidatus Azobacteroides sp.]|nr:hypothetical protein [Candidatus Azobacteroides sp.]
MKGLVRQRRCLCRSKTNRQVLTMVNSGYQVLHLAMGYDGNKNYKICQAGNGRRKKNY